MILQLNNNSNFVMGPRQSEINQIKILKAELVSRINSFEDLRCLHNLENILLDHLVK